MRVSMDNFLFENDQKHFNELLLSGHHIKFCKVKWQLTYSNLLFVRFIRRRRNTTQIIMNLSNYFFSQYIYTLLKRLADNNFHLFLRIKSKLITAKQV